MEYGNVVVKGLSKRDIKAILLIYRGKKMQFEDEYKAIFDFFEINNMRYVGKKDNISKSYLRTYFRTHQSVDTLIVLISDNSKQILGIDI